MLAFEDELAEEIFIMNCMLARIITHTRSLHRDGVNVCGQLCSQVQRNTQYLIDFIKEREKRNIIIFKFDSKHDILVCVF